MRKFWRVILNASIMAALSFIGQLIYYRTLPTADQLYFSMLMFFLTFLTFIRDAFGDVKEYHHERKIKKNGGSVEHKDEDNKILSLWF